MTRGRIFNKNSVDISGKERYTMNIFDNTVQYMLQCNEIGKVSWEIVSVISREADAR